jgi:hypothetical protein
MIDPTKFVFNSDFKYSPIVRSGTTPPPYTFGGTVLATGITGVPAFTVFQKRPNGTFGQYISQCQGYISGGTLYGNIAGDAIEAYWRIYGD